jgi:hypothetical protein
MTTTFSKTLCEIYNYNYYRYDNWYCIGSCCDYYNNYYGCCMNERLSTSTYATTNKFFKIFLILFFVYKNKSIDKFVYNNFIFK